MAETDHRRRLSRLPGIAAAICLAAGILAACGGATTEEDRLPDGTLAYHISCGGTARPMAQCLERGDALCRSRGYRIIGRNGEEITLTRLMIAERIAEAMGISGEMNISIVCGTAPAAAQASR